MIRKFLPQSKIHRFNQICDSVNINLDYDINNESLDVLHNIFVEREYADYFPFYEQATIIDIGAHYGYFSIFASKNLNENSTIYAFEPDAGNFNILKQNLTANSISNVTPVNSAVGKEVGEVELFQGTSVNNSLMASYPLLKSDAIKSKVSLTNLETIINKYRLDAVDFLKVDCEGGEYDIFLRTPCDILQMNKVISLEFHDLKDVNYTGNKLVERLENCRFQIKHFSYSKTTMDLNYGRLIAVFEG